MTKTSAGPAVSVVMSVYNGGTYLRPAIDSVLAQSFRDFEFIVINDGSTDDTAAILKSYTDPRIKIITQKNKGLVAALNTGIARATASIIARMDADDISLPDRFQRQVEYLTNHSECVLIGCSLDFIDESGKITVQSPLLTGDPEIRMELLVRCPFAHGSVMFRADAVRQAGGYRKEAWPAEDYDLWYRLSRLGAFANTTETLFQYRELSAGISISNDALQAERTETVREAIWRDSLLRQIPMFASCAKRYNRTTEHGRIQLGRLVNIYLKIARSALAKGLPATALTTLIKLAGSPYGLWSASKQTTRNLLHI